MWGDNQHDPLSVEPPTPIGAVQKVVALGIALADNMYNYIQKTFTPDVIKAVSASRKQQVQGPRWMTHRPGMVTASVAYSVYTRVHMLQAKLGPHDVRLLLKTIIRENTVQTAAMSRGSALEKNAMAAYSKGTQHRNLQVEKCGLLISKDHPCIGASPDSLVMCDCCSQKVLDVEVHSKLAELEG